MSEMKKVLIADDEEPIRTLVRMTLDNPACEILEASNGKEALKLVYEKRPVLVLLDVSMPGMTGVEVCQAIKQDPEVASTIVVMLSARAQESDLVLAERAGADGYFTKPFSPLALMSKVDDVLTSNTTVALDPGIVSDVA